MRCRTYSTINQIVLSKNMKPRCPKCSGFSLINYFYIPESNVFGIGKVKKVYIGSPNVPKNRSEVHFHSLKIADNLNNFPNIENYSKQIQTTEDGIFECERCKYIIDDVLNLFVDMS